MKMLKLPKKVYFKSGSMNVAFRELNEVYHLKRAFLVSDPDLYRSGIVSQVDRWLCRQGLRTAEYFSIGHPPAFADIRGALPKLLEFEPDVLVGIGGGAAMSAAKAMWALYEMPELELSEAVEHPERIRTGEKAKLALAATSFGSGAQNSPYAVLRDDEGKTRVLNSFCLLPELSVTDAQFTGSLSSGQVRACSLNTLSQAIRAFTADGCCEYTQGLLLEAVQAVLRHWKDAEDGSPAARERLHNAAALAGAAYGNVPFIPDQEALPYPTDAEKAAAGGRIQQLAESLGFSGTQALWDACEALR